MAVRAEVTTAVASLTAEFTKIDARPRRCGVAVAARLNAPGRGERPCLCLVARVTLRIMASNNRSRRRVAREVTSAPHPHLLTSLSLTHHAPPPPTHPRARSRDAWMWPPRRAARWPSIPHAGKDAPRYGWGGEFYSSTSALMAFIAAAPYHRARERPRGTQIRRLCVQLSKSSRLLAHIHPLGPTAPRLHPT